MKALRIITQLWPVVRELVQAVSAASPGGRRITPEELDAIVEKFLQRIARIVRAELA